VGAAREGAAVPWSPSRRGRRSARRRPPQRSPGGGGDSAAGEAAVNTVGRWRGDVRWVLWRDLRDALAAAPRTFLPHPTDAVVLRDAAASLGVARGARRGARR
jgi:hypothetical protein